MLGQTESTGGTQSILTILKEANLGVFLLDVFTMV